MAASERLASDVPPGSIDIPDRLAYASRTARRADLQEAASSEIFPQAFTTGTGKICWGFSTDETLRMEMSHLKSSSKNGSFFKPREKLGKPT
jgi:hypothetical protein